MLRLASKIVLGCVTSNVPLRQHRRLAWRRRPGDRRTPGRAPAPGPGRVRPGRGGAWAWGWAWPSARAQAPQGRAGPPPQLCGQHGCGGRHDRCDDQRGRCGRHDEEELMESISIKNDLPTQMLHSVSAHEKGKKVVKVSDNKKNFHLQHGQYDGQHHRG